MKREQIINKIYDKIRDDLLHAKLLYWEEDDTNKYPLVDHLSSGDDISTGRDEIDNLIEQIEIEPLIDAILALPLEVPSDEEIIYGVQYNPMIHESVFGCLSLHRSRKEAEMEMEFHKHQRMKEDDYSAVERWTIYEYKLK